MTNDITGQRFGKLIAIERVTNDKYGHARYLCKCDCGNEIKVLKSSLTRGFTRSCGCYYKQTRHTSALKHNGTNTRLYSIWCNMKDRCNRPNNKGYKYYGARGIKVCEEWQSFEKFSEWAESNGYDDSLTIDRIDVNKGYSKDNCKWATRLEQANNTRRNHTVELNGKKYTLTDFINLLRISRTSYYNKRKQNMTDEEIYAQFAKVM